MLKKNFSMKYRILIAVCSFLFITTGRLWAQEEDTFVIGYYHSPPFVEISDDNELGGINAWLWESLQGDLQMSYRLKRMPLDSLINQLGSGKVDISLNPLTITSERSEIIDFTTPFFISNSVVITPPTTALQKGLQFVGSFFSLNFLRAVSALFIVIFFFGILVWVFERRKNPEEFQGGVKGLWSGIWWSAVTMTTVGYGDKSPRSVGGRIVALIWMFAAIIIISGFTASIASSLTVNQLGWSKNEIYDFKEESIATVSASATESWLLRNFFDDVKSYQNIEACMEALESGEVSAVTYDEPIIQQLKSIEKYQQYEILPIKYNLQLYAFGLSEDISPELKETISNGILEEIESNDWRVLLAEYGLSQR